MRGNLTLEALAQGQFLFSATCKASFKEVSVRFSQELRDNKSLSKSLTTCTPIFSKSSLHRSSAMLASYMRSLILNVSFKFMSVSTDYRTPRVYYITFFYKSIVLFRLKLFLGWSFPHPIKH